MTTVLHERLRPRLTLGIDSSGEMLLASKSFSAPGLTFRKEAVESFEPDKPYDLVFSNAALQWLPEHPRLFRKITGWLAPHGQLAVQVPANQAHASHRVASEVAGEPPFRDWLGGYTRQPSVLLPEQYAELLHTAGYVEQRVRLEVYGHPLKSAAEVVEWVKGTLLTDYRKRLPEDRYQRFLQTYASRLIAQLGPGPCFYSYKRILLWARRRQ